MFLDVVINVSLVYVLVSLEFKNNYVLMFLDLIEKIK